MSGSLRFPLFVDLTGRRALVVGGGKIALRRIRVLCDYGAAVTVIAPQTLPLPPEVTWIPREYRTGDLEGAFLAVAATDCRAVNRQVGLDANALSIPVSVADAREECSFFFPAVCRGSGLSAGIVSDGSDHSKTARAARAIRSVLEDLL